MKLISWNIDSLNAALTSDSARAVLSRAVIDTLVAEEANIIAIQETKLSAKGPTKTCKSYKTISQIMKSLGVRLLNLLEKATLVPCFFTKRA